MDARSLCSSQTTIVQFERKEVNLKFPFSKDSSLGRMDWPVIDPRIGFGYVARRFTDGNPMRLYSGKVPSIAQEVVRTLTESGEIEVESEAEVQLDLEAVMKEYLRLEREVVEEAKRRMEQRGLGYSNLGRTISQVAKERGAPASDDVLPYLLDQMLNMLFHSSNVAEIYAEDIVLRKKITPILRKHMQVGDDLDQEVRSKIKNLQEGTASFEVEYAKVMDQIKRKRGLN